MERLTLINEFDPISSFRLGLGILKGEVSLYHWPPVWLVWNRLYDYWQFLFLFAKETNPNRRSTVEWYFPFSIPWLGCSFQTGAFKIHLHWQHLTWQNAIINSGTNRSIPIWVMLPKEVKMSVSYLMISMTHPSRNFVGLSLFCVFMPKNAGLWEFC